MRKRARTLPRKKHCMYFAFPWNSNCWAIGKFKNRYFHVRKIVWGRLMARAEKRDDEKILPALIQVDEGID